MKLTVIGCSGSYPGPDSPASCYLLEHEHEGRTWRVLMDLGSGAFGVLQRYVDPLSIDAVLLSHLHADHCLDLCGFYVMRKYHPDGPPPRLPVWGPSDTAGRMARAYDLDEDPGMTAEFDFRSWAPGSEVTIGPFTVTGGAGRAPGRGLRPAGRRRRRHSSPSPATPGAAPASWRWPPAPTCCWPRRRSTTRRTTRPASTSPAPTAARSPSAGGVGRLVITHVPPWYDPQRHARRRPGGLGRPAELAQAGATYDV